MLQPLAPIQAPETRDAVNARPDPQREWGVNIEWVQEGEENTLVPENSTQQMLDHLQRAQEGPSLVDIPACATWELSEVGVPSLHRPEMVGPPDEYPQAIGQGTRSKMRPQYSTKTVAEEMVITNEQGQQASSLKIDFYLPLPGQPCLSEVLAWRAPLWTEQDNEGIYVQIED